jgi:5-methyltetrahydrofolate--homocysteine methyltransferase
MDLVGRIAKERVLVADGAWGTEFFKRGVMQGDPCDEWNLSHPEIVKEITAEYLLAGAEVILTNTFGANGVRLEAHGLGERVHEINLAGARIAREAVGDKAFIAGDVGPSGKLLALGEVTGEELFEIFSIQVKSLAQGGVDCIVVESMTDVEEMAVAVRAAREAAGVPVVACMTYNVTPKGFRTMMGATPESCVQRAASEGAAIIGANCGTGIEDYVPLAPVLRKLTDLPLWVKANAGVPKIMGGKAVYPLGPEQFAAFVPSLVEAGVNVIGGCCGTNPEFVRAIRAKIGRGSGERS